MQNEISANGDEYEPPAIEDIPLRSGEVLLAGCKTSSGAGPGMTINFHLCASCSTPTAS